MQSIENSDFSDNNIAVKHFPHNQDLSDFFEDIKTTPFPAFSLNLGINDVECAVQKYLSIVFPDSHFLNQELSQHIKALAMEYVRVTGISYFNFYFGRVSDGMCHLFHVDNVRYRALKTFVGPGTEWVPAQWVNYSGLGKGKNSRVVKNSKYIVRAKNYELLIFQGRKLTDFALVHRSPPVEDHSQVRILLRIDSEIKNY